MGISLDKTNLLRLVTLLEEEVEKAYLSSPVEGKEVDQRLYEGWMACCAALRRIGNMMPNLTSVDSERLTAMIEAIAESPTALDRFNFKIAKLGKKDA